MYRYSLLEGASLKLKVEYQKKMSVAEEKEKELLQRCRVLEQEVRDIQPC